MFTSYLYNYVFLLRYYLFKKRINDKFWKNIRIKSERLNNPIFITSDRKEIHYRIAEDGGFYFGFYFKDNTQKNICLNREEFEYYKNVLNEKDKSRNPKFNSNENHIVWIFSNFINSGKKFLDLNKEFIFSLKDENAMNDFTDKIINELDIYINEIKNEFEYGKFSNLKKNNSLIN